MLRTSLVSLTFLLISVTATRAQEPKATWQAGVDRVAITPAQPMWMSGYGARNKPSEGKVHDLSAKALVLQDAEGRRCVLVTMDLLGMHRQLADAICADIGKRCGVPRDAVMLSFSHTHCGPVVGNNLRAMYTFDEPQEKRVEDYAKDLHAKVVDLALKAQAAMMPVAASFGNGFTTFATNRRENKEADAVKLRELGRLKGPVDHQVPVLSLRDPQGKLRAIVFGYACHATVMDFYLWCGDYPTFAQLALEKRHPEAVAMFFAGCGGDQNPLPRRGIALAEGYGNQLADAVDLVLAGPMQNIPPSLKTTFRRIDLPFSELPGREKLDEESRDKNRFIAGRARLLLQEFAKNGSLPKSYPYPVQAWQLGPELTWVALGGEVVVDYSLRLKKELGPLWVAGYTNDVMAYIPSRKVLKEGGYEGATSMIYYGQPTTWAPEIEERIVEAVHAEVAKVRKAGR